jgi:hypothetical protein
MLIPPNTILCYYPKMVSAPSKSSAAVSLWSVSRGSGQSSIRDNSLPGNPAHNVLWAHIYEAAVIPERTPCLKSSDYLDSFPRFMASPFHSFPYLIAYDRHPSIILGHPGFNVTGSHSSLVFPLYVFVHCHNCMLRIFVTCIPCIKCS